MKALLRLPYALVQWASCIVFKVALIVLGLIAVPIALAFKEWPKILWLWGNDEEGCPDWWLNMEKPKVKDIFPRWWWYVIRNPINNFRFLFDEPENVKTYGEDELESKTGFQWRYRHSTFLDSFRCTWGEPRKSEGKREFYIGWKLGSSVPGLGFAFSFRPF
jgi:hypothetical protein